MAFAQRRVISILSWKREKIAAEVVKQKKKIMGLPNLYFLLLLFSLLSFLQTPTSAAKKASLHLYIFFYSFYYFLYLIFQIHFSSTKLSLVNFCFKKCSDNTRKLYLLIIIFWLNLNSSKWMHMMIFDYLFSFKSSLGT